MIILTLPYPPSVNSIWRAGNGRIYKSAGYNAWIKEAGWMAKAQHPGKLTGKYFMWILATAPDRRRRDVANLEKVVSDLLQSLEIVRDDSDCQSCTIAWSGEVVKGGALRVSIEAA